MINKRIPAIVIDDFFDNPDEIRNYALSLSYDSPRGLYPGFRSEQIKFINPKLYDSLNSRILSTFYDQQRDYLDVTIESQFQIIPKRFEEGWCHQDSDYSGRNFAGVIYLSPNAPLDAGTAIYKQISNPNYELLNLRNEYYRNGEYSDMEHYRQCRNEFNSHFAKTLEIKNVYNRLIMYDTYEFHKESAFFGNDINDARMTIVFFMTVSPMGKSEFPITRMKKFKIELN